MSDPTCWGPQRWAHNIAVARAQDAPLQCVYFATAPFSTPCAACLQFTVMWWLEAAPGQLTGLPRTAADVAQVAATPALKDDLWVQLQAAALARRAALVPGEIHGDDGPQWFDEIYTLHNLVEAKIQAVQYGRAGNRAASVRRGRFHLERRLAMFDAWHSLSLMQIVALATVELMQIDHLMPETEGEQWLLEHRVAAVLTNVAALVDTWQHTLHDPTPIRFFNIAVDQVLGGLPRRTRWSSLLGLGVVERLWQLLRPYKLGLPPFAELVARLDRSFDTVVDDLWENHIASETDGVSRPTSAGG